MVFKFNKKDKSKKNKKKKVNFNEYSRKEREEEKIEENKERFIKKKEKERKIREENKKSSKYQSKHDPNRDFLVKYSNKNKNKVSVMKNMLINDGQVTAYYILKPFNYDVADEDVVESHISSLYNTVSTMYSALGEVEVSIFKIRNIISKREVIREMVETVQMYKTKYKDIDPRYEDLISAIREDFSIMAVNIDISKHVNVETQSMSEIAKNSLNSFFMDNFSTRIQDINEIALMEQNKKITDILDLGAIPANEKLVLNIYINSLFPDYNIIYSNFIMNNASDIIANIRQDIIPHLGWFELSNIGIATVGAQPMTTYGSILSIVKFPDEIESKYFNMNIPGLVTNIRCRPKEKVEVDFRRMRADTKAEYKDAAVIGDEDNESGQDWDDINDAISAIRRGRILADMDAQILITGDSKEELDTKRSTVISILADMGIIAGIAENQAKIFMDSFVYKKPKKYFHTADLEYALAFNQDHGVLVGDSDSKYYAPTIGESNT